VTVVQSARVAGFRAQLAVRGHNLRSSPDGPSLPALLQPATDEKGEYQLAEETSVTDIAVILREDIPAPVQPGAILTEGQAQYRVVRVEDHPVDVAVRLHCEAVNL